MAHRRYRTCASADWGEFFGLTPEDLTIEQIKKIKFTKLLEIANQDSRVEKIIGDRIMKCEISDLESLDRLEQDEIDSLPYLVSQYNKCVRERSKDIEKKISEGYYHRREKYIYWNWLNKSNKAKEFSRWLGKEDSIIEENSINYSWLYNNYPWLADKITEKILSKASNAYNQSAAIRLVVNLPEAPIKKYVARIFEAPSSISMHLLSNQYAPRDYIIKSLRAIAGKKRIPKLNVTLDKSMLLELPSVMRLNLLESLLIHMRSGHVKFSDINNEDELKPLLFGTAIKYNSRVQYVVNRFRYISS